MCRFVAVFSKKIIEMDEYVEWVKGQARKGKRSPHPDGFGYWIKGDGEYHLRTTAPAWEVDISVPRGRVAFIHARKAGEEGAPVSLNNVHPFIIGKNVFMHNGLVRMPRHPAAVGGTDTESYFLTLLDMGVEEGLRHIGERYDFVSLNFVMWKDGKFMIFRAAREREDYFTLWVKQEDTIVVSTEKGEGEWNEVPNGELWVLTEKGFETRCIFPDMCR